MNNNTMYLLIVGVLLIVIALVTLRRYKQPRDYIRRQKPKIRSDHFPITNSVGNTILFDRRDLITDRRKHRVYL